MAPESRGWETVARLIEKGAFIPNPASVDIGDDVDLGNLSGEISIYPGCRIYGAKTVVCAGAQLGAEAPVTVDDCRVGPKVELKGGYFRRSVFLEGANLGSSAQVREGCLLEEEAGGAHCVGLKQTILFPFVTLGSLINFCDCLMAGGTSRSDHSEVGSSYIHFNYTPDGDKTTASLFGDVPRGVMLDQRPIFLGGQGGAVGPVRVGFGTVVTAGSVLRSDVLADGKLVAVAPPQRDLVRDRRPHSYAGLTRTVRNNLIYLANLVALEEWYRAVRRPFFARQDMGLLVYEGSLEVLAGAKQERMKRLLALAAKVPETVQGAAEWRAGADSVCRLFETPPERAAAQGEGFATEVGALTAGAASYVDAVRALPGELAGRGVHWLQLIVDTLMAEAAGIVPALGL